MEEMEAIRKKYGIETYVIIFKDPDSDMESTTFGGALAWICGHCEFIADLMKKRYNSDRY